MKNIVFLTVTLISINAYSQEKNGALHAIFDDIEKFENSFYPEDSLYDGIHIKGAFSKATEASYLAELEQNQEFISRLIKITDDKLSRQDFISKQVMILRLGDFVSYTKYNMHMIPLNAEGGFYLWISFALNRLPFSTNQNYQDYISWLPSYAVWLEEYFTLMQNGIKAGVVAPKVVIQNNIKLIEPWINDDVEINPFYKPLKNIPENWDQKEAEEFRKNTEKIITKQIIPVYKKIDNFLRTDYLAASSKNPGVMFLKDGKSYYEDKVSYYTTFKMTPDSVHLLGLQEVNRIKKLMLEIIEKTKFEGSFEGFLSFLRTDEQFYAKSPQELLNYAAWLGKKAEGQLPKLFKTLPSLPYSISPVPDAIAPTHTGAKYIPGSWEQQRAAVYRVNTYNLESRKLYTLPSLTIHEAVPGHHLQIALAQELSGIPKFRNNYFITAFGEGWALYSEFLGEEMGMYSTPYEEFGRYTYEMWRACRLVVDTGIHYKGWSREKALNYLKVNTALSLHEINTEIDRYIGRPGQAVSYKIGELKIKSLRKKAEDLLDENFDIREFHYHVLKNGSVTLPILEEEIDLYINSVLEK